MQRAPIKDLSASVATLQVNWGFKIDPGSAHTAARAGESNHHRIDERIWSRYSKDPARSY